MEKRPCTQVTRTERDISIKSHKGTQVTRTERDISIKSHKGILEFLVCACIVHCKTTRAI